MERLHGQHFETVRQAKDEALDWLLWYNQTRLHSTLNYVSPMQYEQNWALQNRLRCYSVPWRCSNGGSDSSQRRHRRPRHYPKQFVEF